MKANSLFKTKKKQKKLEMDGQTNDTGGSPLHCAVAGKFTNMVISLLERSAAELINTQDKHGRTPLHLACSYSLLDDFVLLDCDPADLPCRKLSEMEKIIQLLLAHGADPEILDEKGKAPFHLLINSLTGNWYSDNDHLENIGKKIIDHFLLNGADINMKDAAGRTALHYVSGLSRFNVIPPEPGFPRNRRIFNDLCEPHECRLIWEHLNNRNNPVRPIQHDEPNLLEQNLGGIPLANGSPQNAQRTEVCEKETLPPLGYERNVKKCHFEPPLDEVHRKHFLIHLLNRGSDINAVDDELCTPLHWAVIRDKYHIVEELLVRNANINTKDCEGKTPLHYGVSSNSKLINCGMLLLKKGALASIKDKRGNTPTDIARDKSFYPIFVKFLVLFMSVNMHPETDNITSYSTAPVDIFKKESQRLNEYFEDSGCSQLSKLLQTYRIPVYTKNEFFAAKINEPRFERLFPYYSETLKRKFYQDKRRMKMIEYCVSCIDRLGNLPSDSHQTPFYWKDLPEEIKQKILSYLSDNDLEQCEERFRMVLALRYRL